jgi:hypothetical protein
MRTKIPPLLLAIATTARGAESAATCHNTRPDPTTPATNNRPPHARQNAAEGNGDHDPRPAMPWECPPKAPGTAGTA